MSYFGEKTETPVKICIANCSTLSVINIAWPCNVKFKSRYEKGFNDFHFFDLQFQLKLGPFNIFGASKTNSVVLGINVI